MQRTRFTAMDCPITRSLDRVGEWWSILILRDALGGMTRFEEFQKSLKIAPNMLTRRLNALVEAGFLARRRYSERPPRHDYRLTDKGRDLWPVLTTMRQWGDKHAAPDGPPLELIHGACGERSQAVLTCSACGERVGARDVKAIPGPGAVERLIRTA